MESIHTLHKLSLLGAVTYIMYMYMYIRVTALQL